MAIGVWAACCPGSARAGELAADVQALLLLKVLAYDRNLTPVDGVVSISVVYRPGPGPSEVRATDFVTAMTEVAGRVTVGGNRVRVKLETVGDLLRATDGHPTVVWLAPDLGADLALIRQQAREVGLFTVSGSEEHLRSELCLVLSSREARPRLVVRLPTCIAEGADLSAELLGVADVIR